MDVEFVLGEDKYVKFLIRSCKGEDFEIESASYILYLDQEEEASGICKIDDHYITAKLSPLCRSKRYCLEVTYHIADEILKKRVRIEVV